jgi:kynurenine formamidase
MFSFDGYKPVDLSPRLSARVYRVDGSIEEGNTDPYGKPWVMQEGRFAGDNSLYTLYSAPVTGDPTWHKERMTSHHGSHVQGGGGHISHWAGAAEGMQGVWEMPLETFMGEAAVCNLTDLTPQPMKEPGEYPLGQGYNMRGKEGDVRGQEIKPEHLSNIEEGDIVLMTSPFTGLEQPWLSKPTCEWLINDRKIKMLGIGVPGIEWQYDLKIAAPNNSPIRRMLLGANIPIAHPLVNIETLTKDRVFYVGMPLRTEKMEASFIRALALEEQ